MGALLKDLSLLPVGRSLLSLVGGALVVASPLIASPLPATAQTQIQLSCSGAVVEARGNAELKRATRQLRLSLSLEAEAAPADAALVELQRRRQLAIGEEPHEATAAPSRHRP